MQLISGAFAHPQETAIQQGLSSAFNSIANGLKTNWERKWKEQRANGLMSQAVNAYNTGNLQGMSAEALPYLNLVSNVVDKQKEEQRQEATFQVGKAAMALQYAQEHNITPTQANDILGEKDRQSKIKSALTLYKGEKAVANKYATNLANTNNTSREKIAKWNNATKIKVKGMTNKEYDKLYGTGGTKGSHSTSSKLFSKWKTAVSLIDKQINKLEGNGQNGAFGTAAPIDAKTQRKIDTLKKQRKFFMDKITASSGMPANLIETPEPTSTPKTLEYDPKTGNFTPQG